MENQESYMQFCQNPERVEKDCASMSEMLAVFSSLMQEIGRDDMVEACAHSARHYKFFDV